MRELPEKEIITCTVEHVTYRNGDTGFTVLETRSGGEQLTVVGVMPDVQNGETLEVSGAFHIHPTFGRQFKADTYVRTTPADAAAILRYLSSGAVRGIGPKTAQRIVARFGDETIDILENHPERLTGIKGITPERAEKIAEEMKQRRSMRDTLAALVRYGLTAPQAMNAFRVLGADAAVRVENNPYLLCREDIGVDFETADGISASLELGSDNSDRLRAALLYVLRHNLGNGHCCLPENKLAEVTKRLLGADHDLERITSEMLEEGELCKYENERGTLIFLPEYYAAEQYVAARLAMRMSLKVKEKPLSDGEIARVEKESGIKYAEMQKEALRLSLDGGAMILTGGPGTGKTTTLNAMIKLFDSRGLEVALAAPTGRAAKRMSELCGREAKTIHRLLEVSWTDENDQPFFGRCERNPLDCDVLVLDEMSMVDIKLFESVLRALRMDCRLILVGDSDQLPSVGAGNVLRDLIESGTVPVVRLTEIFRQARESLIVMNAHRIVGGEYPELGVTDKDFFFIRRSGPQGTVDTVASLCAERLPEAYGYSAKSDIQVLCASRMTGAGTAALNERLGAVCNPASADKPAVVFRGVTYRLGDKIMQIKNNYEAVWEKDDGESGTGVYNGDIGVITGVDVGGMGISARFDDRTVEFYGEQLGELELAWAVTIHKSQGSEFNCVILPLIDVPPKLCYRNLLYTAVTRAKQRLIIVGSESVVKAMVNNDRRMLRYSALRDFLREASE